MPPPLVSVITPCFNAARYVEQTIQSVLSQDYPYIEYLVLDGGSTDGTVEILRRYEAQLTWTSGPDGGTADALHQGFARSHGTILAFLNADDTYAPGAVRTAVRHLERHPGAAVVYGEGQWTDECGKAIGCYPTQDYDPARFARECYLCQPAAFFRRAAYEAVGGIDPGLQYTFDYDLWIRLARQGGFVRVPELLAYSRMHQETKTLGARRRVFAETFALLRKHFGYVPFSWVYADTCYRLDGRDQFYEPLQPSLVKYAAALPVGLWANWRRPARYVREWAGVMSWAGLRRRVKG